MLLAADSLTDGDLSVDGFWWALLVALVASAVTLVLEVMAGVDDDSEYSFRVIQRIARRTGEPTRTDVPGIVFLEIDGLALPVLRRAMRDGNAPNMARWIAEDGYHLTGWETDLSSQTGASQAGILLGSNENIPAFRWVEKATGRVMTCSAPADCAEIERRHATDKGLLMNGGASRGNLLSGQADEVILTVSRIEAEKQANPGLPDVLRERLQRDPGARPRRLGGDPRVDGRPEGRPARRPAARPSRRRLPVHARRDVHRRPRPDRPVGPHGHDEGTARGLRDLLELRRGRPPLGPRARRHARGAAQARPAVRAHREGPPLRPPSVRDRRPLRPRSDAGRDVQAAERLRARRARPALARGGRRDVPHERRRERQGRRSRLRRGDGPRREGGEAREERRHRARTSSCSPRATSVSCT